MAGDMTSIRERSDAELQQEVGELRKQLFHLRWQAAGGQLEKPSKIREVRREIARHLTVLRERELASRAGGRS